MQLPGASSRGEFQSDMSDGEQRDRKPQVNGQGGDEAIQIKVKMGGSTLCVAPG